MIKKFMIILVILISIVLSGCKTPEPPEPIDYRALLVGVEDCIYIDSMDLPVAGYNVKRLKEIFSACRFTNSEIEFSVINILRGKEPTKETILSSILSTFGEANENDISYFYFMGHGGLYMGQPILCPTDYNGALKYDITLEELEITFDMIQGTKILFLESCHSGNFIEKGKDLDYFKIFNNKIIRLFSAERAFNKGNYQVITSCKGNQFSYYYGVMSYFTMGLYQGCRNLNADSNGDEIIDLSELYEYTVDWIENNAHQNQDAQMYPDNSNFTIVEY